MIRYVCSKCGYVLFEFPSDKWKILLTPGEVIYIYESKCPRCGKELEPDKTPRIRVSLSTKCYKL